MMKRALPFVLLLLIVGCRTKLDSKSEVTLGPGDIKSVDIDAIKSAQTVNVSAQGDGGKFHVYFFLAKDQAAVELNPDKAAAKLLDHKKDVTEASLSATVPANEKAVVMLWAVDKKKVEVKLKITN